MKTVYELIQEYKKTQDFTNNILIGAQAGYNLKGAFNICIGDRAGIDLTDSKDVVIIGDDIHSNDTEEFKDTLIIGYGHRFIVGDTLFGKKCNLKEILMEYIKSLKIQPLSLNKD